MIYLFFLLVRLYIYVAIGLILFAWGVLWCIGRLIVLAIEAGQKRQIDYPPINTPIERYQANRR